MSDCFDHEGDAIDDLCFGRTYDEGAGGSSWKPLSKTCTFCGMKDLYWMQVDDRWRLCKYGKPHSCDAFLRAKQ